MAGSKMTSGSDLPPPPEAWGAAHRASQVALAPLRRFLHMEASSGILLLLAAAVAMVWANSPWAGSYEALWSAPVKLGLGPWLFERDLRFWVNDGLMTIFFFVVGLEIRREMHRGELSSLRRASLPLAAALGGMVVPALIFLSLNPSAPSAEGWGVPMATDIAFAVGVFALLGNRIPSPLRVLLLAVAVIDDVGAILVIAFFYSSGISMGGMAVAGLGLLALFVWRWLGVRSPWAYVPPAALLWAGTYAAGIHPTLAGVVLGMLTPITPWLGPRKLVQEMEELLPDLRDSKDSGQLLHAVTRLQGTQRESVSVVERLEHALHGWVAYGVMPIFALANAGVALGGAELSGAPLMVMVGIAVGLLVGKPVGIVLFSYAAAKIGISTMPPWMKFRHLLVLGLVAAIGFTMAIFIAGLAFPGSELLESAKLGILAASGTAAVLGLSVGWIMLKPSKESH